MRRFMDYWSSEHYLMGASALRILFGVNVLWLYVSNLAQRTYLWGPNGVVTNAMSQQALSAGREFSLYNLSPSPIFFNLLFFLGMLITVLYILGLYPRILGVLMYAATYSLYSKNYLLLDGGNNILVLELFYLMFAQSGAYFGLHSAKIRSAVARRSAASLWRQLPALTHNMAVTAVMLQLCLMYFVSFIFKVHGHEWYRGTAIYYVLRTNEFRLPGISHLLYDSPLLINLLTYGTLLFQGAFPFLIWNRRLKPVMLIGATLFHLGIAYVMGLAWFSITMLSADAIFVTDDMYTDAWKKLRRLAVALGRRATSIGGLAAAKIASHPAIRNQKLVVLYDDACPICRLTVAKWSPLDWFSLVDFQSLWTYDVENSDVSRTVLAERMHAIRMNDGRVFAGCQAIMHLTARIPALIPISAMCYLGLRLRLGEHVYDFLARRRYVIPIGQCSLASCQLESEHDG